MRSYRLVKVSTLYGPFADDLSHAVASDAPFEDLHDAYVRSLYGWSDFITTRLRARGHEAYEVVAHGRFQQAWARDHGSTGRSEAEVLIEQIRSHAPDIVFLQDLYAFPLRARSAIRAALPDVRLVGWRSAPTADFGAFRDLDLVLTSAASFVDRFRASGVTAAHVPHAFAPEVLNGLRPATCRPFTFAGSVGHWSGLHRRRYLVIEELLGRTPLEVFGTAGSNPWQSHRWKLMAARAMHMASTRRGGSLVGRALRGWQPWIAATNAGGDPGRPDIGEQFPTRVHPPVFGRAYYELLAGSQLTLNVHLDATGSDPANMRLFEATGVGACLVTEHQPGLERYFEPDKEVVVYRTLDECVEKVTELLDDDVQRCRIADAGQARTLADHTFDERVPTLDALLQSVLR